MNIERRSFLMLAAAGVTRGAAPTPPFRVVDLQVGQSERVVLPNAQNVTVKAIAARAQRDTIRYAVRSVAVDVEIDGERIVLDGGPYRLPVRAGRVQIDCPFTRDYMNNAHQDSWGLERGVRLRLWPANSPWMTPGAIAYPARQRWFATDTQMSNEPSHVNGAERFGADSIYYHSGLDIGGAEGMVDVIAATDGLLVQVGKELLPEHKGTPASPRYDVLYVVDERGWYYRYSHLQSFAPGLRLGQRVQQGQLLGVLGKEGASGGWSHLHFEIKSRQPSGKWGTEDGYAFLWEAWQREQKPDIIAVARPHSIARIGETVRLDAGRSWSRTGRIVRHEWTFTDGTKAEGATLTRVYPHPGTYSEILKITDSAGKTTYDFAVVQVLDPTLPDQPPPTIHAAYGPTQRIRAGQELTFKVRTYRTTEGQETWNFGDGTARVTVKSDGCVKPLAKDGYAVTTHAYAKPGMYIARVERKTDRGWPAIAHVAVEVSG